MTDSLPKETVADRITAYLSGGGLFNPELADHDAVRDLLIECRTELTKLRRDVDEAKQRSFCDGRISYRGFSYGVGSQWGIDSLKSAIKRNGHD